MKVKVTCANCGKEEYVSPSRAKKYKCCSVDCLAKYNSKTRSQKIELICPICGKVFYRKQSIVNKQKTLCCCKTCADELKKITYLGENNHQYGLKGDKNSSFKGNEITRNNNNLVDIFVYVPEHPFANKNGRVKKHRLIVEENYEKFDEKYFTRINEKVVLKPEIDVHHIDGNHDNNEISNLIPLTHSEHCSLHNQLRKLNNIASNIGVDKSNKSGENP